MKWTKHEGPAGRTGIAVVYTTEVSIADTRAGDRPARRVTFRVAPEEYGRRGWRIDRHDFGPMWSAASPQVFGSAKAAKAAFAAAVGQPGALGLERWQVVLGAKSGKRRNPARVTLDSITRGRPFDYGKRRGLRTYVAHFSDGSTSIVGPGVIGNHASDTEVRHYFRNILAEKNRGWE